jgi:hypothetical protein
VAPVMSVRRAPLEGLRRFIAGRKSTSEGGTTLVYWRVDVRSVWWSYFTYRA